MRSHLPLEEDPIAALATPPGTSALAIIRMSGTGLKERLLPLLRRLDGRLATSADLTPRILQRMDIVDCHDHGKVPLDKIMVVFFPGPHSYTGEDSAEIHCHGSPVIVKHILEHLTQMGIRPAQPGEFTRRACLNGKMDLTQAEALAALINAATLRSAQEAMRQLEGSLSKRITMARERLLTVLAHLEVTLDFTEDEIAPLPFQALLMELVRISESLSALLRTSTLGSCLHDGFQLLIVGRPNVGKSSLFNQLLGRQRAIVSPTPGTTRDCIESRLEIQGILIVLTDTAGLRDTQEAVEMEGIKLTKERLAQADGILLVLDAHTGITSEDEALLQTLPAGRAVVVWNKMDLIAPASMVLPVWPNRPTVSISCMTGEGLESLLAAIGKLFLPMPTDGEGAIIMAVRQKEALIQAIHALAECESLIAHNDPVEIAALSLRSALEALGELVGQITHEALLDRIFGTFCLGK